MPSIARSLATVIGLLAVGSTSLSPAPAEQPPGPKLKPIVSMEQLMEDLIHPAFLSLKRDLANPPETAKEWQRVRAAGALVGESANLLLFRAPDDTDAAEWSVRSVHMRDAGERLLEAVRAHDYTATRKRYAAIVQACNGCHIQFGEDSEPKIAP